MTTRKDKLRQEAVSAQQNLFQVIGTDVPEIMSAVEQVNAANEPGRLLEAERLDAIDRDTERRTVMAKNDRIRKTEAAARQSEQAKLPEPRVDANVVAKQGGGQPQAASLEGIVGGADVQSGFQRTGQPGQPGFQVHEETTSPALGGPRGAFISRILGLQPQVSRAERPDVAVMLEQNQRSAEAHRANMAEHRRSRLKATQVLDADLTNSRYSASSIINLMESDSPLDQAVAQIRLEEAGLRSRNIAGHQERLAELQVQQAEMQIDQLRLETNIATRQAMEAMSYRAVGVNYNPNKPMSVEQMNSAALRIAEGEAGPLTTPLINQLYGDTATNALDGHILFVRQSPKGWKRHFVGGHNVGYMVPAQVTTSLILRVGGIDPSDPSKPLSRKEMEQARDQLEELTGARMEWNNDKKQFVRPGIFDYNQEDAPLIHSHGVMFRSARLTKDLLLQSGGQLDIEEDLPGNPEGAPSDPLTGMPAQTEPVPPLSARGAGQAVGEKVGGAARAFLAYQEQKKEHFRKTAEQLREFLRGAAEGGRR
jgi:hypothetical protein